MLGGDAPPAPAGEAADPAPARRYSKKCLPGVAGAVASNQTLVKWLPAKQSIDDLFAATEQEKETPANDTTRVRVAYQTPVPVVWNGHNDELAGRTLEEASGLENAEWCQSAEQRKLGLRLRGALADPVALAAGLHKRVSGDKFDKAKFALGVLTARPEEWQVPAYTRRKPSLSCRRGSIARFPIPTARKQPVRCGPRLRQKVNVLFPLSRSETCRFRNH